MRSFLQFPSLSMLLFSFPFLSLIALRPALAKPEAQVTREVKPFCSRLLRLLLSGVVGHIHRCHGEEVQNQLLGLKKLALPSSPYSALHPALGWAVMGCSFFVE